MFGRVVRESKYKDSDFFTVLVWALDQGLNSERLNTEPSCSWSSWWWQWLCRAPEQLTKQAGSPERRFSLERSNMSSFSSAVSLASAPTFFLPREGEKEEQRTRQIERRGKTKGQKGKEERILFLGRFLSTMNEPSR